MKEKKGTSTDPFSPQTQAPRQRIKNKIKQKTSAIVPSPAQSKPTRRELLAHVYSGARPLGHLAHDASGHQDLVQQILAGRVTASRVKGCGLAEIASRVESSAVCLVKPLVGGLGDWLVGWLVGWVVGWLAGWLGGWVAAWLVEQQGEPQDLLKH